MKKLITPILLLVLLFSIKAKALPMSGGYSIPGTHTSLAAFIKNLNDSGVNGTNVVLKLNIDQVAPSGGYLVGSDTLNFSPTRKARAAVTVTIIGNGHTITAAPGSGAHDAIFTIQGTDYVTIDSLHLVESSSNTTATSMMEHGYSIVKYTKDDACKNVNIQNCRITLNNTNTTAAAGVSHYGSAGVFIGNCTYSSTTALPAPALYEGAVETVFANRDTISNVNHGVYGNGTGLVIDGIAFNDQNLYVQNCDIGNFTHNGIYLVFFNNDNVSYNSINNLKYGGVAASANSINGIVYNGAITAATNNNWTCQKNNIQLTLGGTGNLAATGIYSQIWGTGTTTISEDTIKLTSTGSAAQLIGVFQRNRGGNSTISKNLIQDFSVSSTTNTALNSAGIWNGQNSSGTGLLQAYPTNSIITGNVIRNFTFASAGALYGCLDFNTISADPSTFTDNIVNNINVTTSATLLKGYMFRNSYTVGPPSITLTCTGNTFSNFNTTSLSTPITVIDPAANIYVTGDLSKNRIQNITAGTGALIGVVLDFAKQMTMVSDTFINFKGSADVSGFRLGFGGGGSVTTAIFDKNLLDSFSTGGTSNAVAAMTLSTGASNPLTTCTITKSVIKRMIANGTGATASAIVTAGNTTTYNINNNLISDIVATNNTGAYSSSFGMNLGSTGTNNIYYNTVNMVSGTTAGSGYGSTGLIFSPGATGKYQNNILRVNVTAGAANNVAAIRGASGSALAAPSTTAFGAASNIYFAPTGTNNYLYVDGTTNASLVNGFNVSGLTANTAKNIVNDTFFNSECNRSSYHKYMQSGALAREVNTFTENNLSGSAGIYVPAGMSFADGTALDGPVGSDFSGAARPSGASDIGAIEFNGTPRPILNITITSSTGYDTACPYNLPVLTGAVPTYFNRVSYQWYRDTTIIPGAKNRTLNVTPVTGNYILKVYDSVTGCTYASAPYRIVVVPPPPAIITYYDSLTFCETSAIVIQANKGTGYLYRWMRNGVFIPGETDDHLVVDKSGDYSLEVNTKLGCPTNSTAIRVKVYPLPSPVIFYAAPRLLGVTNKYFTYQWYKNNVKIPAPEGEGFRLFILEDAAYTVEVTDSNGCTSKSDVYLYSLGVDEQKVSASIKIYPNPVTDRLVIESPVAVDAQLTDLAGRIIESHKDVKVVETGSLAEGMYLLSLMDKEGNLIRVEKINKTK